MSTSPSSSTATQVQAVQQQQEEQLPVDEPYNTLFCRTLYDYEAQDAAGLSFRSDDIIEVLTQQPSGWWDGLLGGKRGWFPSSYVTIISDDEEELAFSQAEFSTVDGQTSGMQAQPDPTVNVTHIVVQVEITIVKVYDTDDVGIKMDTRSGDGTDATFKVTEEFRENGTDVIKTEKMADTAVGENEMEESKENEVDVSGTDEQTDTDAEVPMDSDNQRFVDELLASEGLGSEGRKAYRHQTPPHPLSLSAGYAVGERFADINPATGKPFPPLPAFQSPYHVVCEIPLALSHGMGYLTTHPTYGRPYLNINTQNSGNITNSNISNIGNDYSTTYYLTGDSSRQKPRLVRIVNWAICR